MNVLHVWLKNLSRTESKIHILTEWVLKCSIKFHKFFCISCKDSTLNQSSTAWQYFVFDFCHFYKEKEYVYHYWMFFVTGYYNINVVKPFIFVHLSLDIAGLLWANTEKNPLLLWLEPGTPLHQVLCANHKAKPYCKSSQILLLLIRRQLIILSNYTRYATNYSTVKLLETPSNFSKLL